MNPQSYWHRIQPGSRTARIGVSDADASRWGVWIDGTLISDDFGSAAEAAFRANRKDFSDESAIALFNGIWVPPDLASWRSTPPEKIASLERKPMLMPCSRKTASNPRFRL